MTRTRTASRARSAPSSDDTTGVALAEWRAGVTPKRHVWHAMDAEWQITSDTPLEKMLDADLLDRLLPGRLGTYFYPSDAVFHRCDRTHTTVACLDKVVATETAAVTARVTTDEEETIHHRTVRDRRYDDIEEETGAPQPHLEPVARDESDDDEYSTEGEEEDKEEDEEPDGIEDGEAWSDDEDAPAFTRVTRSGAYLVENRPPQSNEGTKPKS